jgi:cohesin loading factor subunit SCC2
MPKTAAKFASELQLALQPMILKPSTAGGVQVSDERAWLVGWITLDI